MTSFKMEKKKQWVISDKKNERNISCTLWIGMTDLSIPLSSAGFTNTISSLSPCHPPLKSQVFKPGLDPGCFDASQKGISKNEKLFCNPDYEIHVLHVATPFVRSRACVRCYDKLEREQKVNLLLFGFAVDPCNRKSRVSSLLLFLDRAATRL